MPLTPLAVPAFPNVPDLPGVPALARLAGTILPPPVLAVADSLGIPILNPQWGIFDSSGNLAISADSVVAIDSELESNVPTYPLEQGAFTSYNKVQLPRVVRVTLALSGAASLYQAAQALSTGTLAGGLGGITGTSARTAFLTSITAAQQSLTLLNLVMPEVTYLNMTITHHDFERTAEKGVSLLQVNLTLEEVRVTATSTVMKARSASAADPVYGGTVQTIPYKSQQLPNLTPS